MCFLSELKSCGFGDGDVFIKFNEMVEFVILEWVCVVYYDCCFWFDYV